MQPVHIYIHTHTHRCSLKAALLKQSSVETFIKSYNVDIYVKIYKRSDELETKKFKKLGQSPHHPSLGSFQKTETSQKKKKKKAVPFFQDKTNRTFTSFQNKPEAIDHKGKN